MIAAIGGCGAETEDDPEAVIRGWSRAVNAGDYDRAGAFFAPNAVVQQVDEVRLRGPADGARFSASLPLPRRRDAGRCRAAQLARQLPPPQRTEPVQRRGRGPLRGP